MTSNDLILDRTHRWDDRVKSDEFILDKTHDWSEEAS